MPNDSVSTTPDTTSEPAAPVLLRLTETQIAGGVLAAVSGALLLRLSPVSSVLKLGLIGAGAWAAYRHADKAGWLSAPGMHADDSEALELEAASKRLADAWGAHYQAPRSDA